MATSTPETLKKHNSDNRTSYAGVAVGASAATAALTALASKVSGGNAFDFIKQHPKSSIGLIFGSSLAGVGIFALLQKKSVQDQIKKLIDSNILRDEHVKKLNIALGMVGGTGLTLLVHQVLKYLMKHNMVHRFTSKVAELATSFHRRMPNVSTKLLLIIAVVVALIGVASQIPGFRDSLSKLKSKANRSEHDEAGDPTAS